MNKAEFKAIAKRYYQGSLKPITKEEFENALDKLLENEYELRLKLQRKELIKKSHYQEQIDEEKLDELAINFIRQYYGPDWDENDECGFKEFCETNYYLEIESFKVGYRSAFNNKAKE